MITRSMHRDSAGDLNEPRVSLLLEQTPWVTPEATARIARLERLSASSSLNADDVDFLLESLAKEIPAVDPSQRDIPIAQSAQGQRWFLVNQEVSLARATAATALRRDDSIPAEARQQIEHELLVLLDSEDPSTRLAGTTFVVSSRMIENPAHRARIEAVRLGDADASVRANAERQLAHYAYIYEGGPPADRPEGCNTCP